MRISDWSSDVCSSDLSGRAEPSRIGWISVADGAMLAALATSGENISTALIRTNRGMRDMDYSSQRTTSDRLPLCRSARQGAQRGLGMKARSEEHTSELQSLMRTSYAVFCLKNKNSHTTT